MSALADINGGKHMSYYGGRAYWQAQREEPTEDEWVCENCGTINLLDWPCCDHCGYDPDGNPPKDAPDE
jgi:hypothetical protein